MLMVNTRDKEYLEEFDILSKEVEKARELGRALGYQMLNAYYEHKREQRLRLTWEGDLLIVYLNDKRIPIAKFTCDKRIIKHSFLEGVHSVWLYPQPPKTMYV